MVGGCPVPSSLSWLLSVFGEAGWVVSMSSPLQLDDGLAGTSDLFSQACPCNGLSILEHVG